jgi:cobalt-zinc-cadmium efflux system outer membrane protein
MSLRLEVAALATLLFACGCETYETKSLDPRGQLANLRTVELSTFKVEHAKPGEDGSHSRTLVFNPTDGLTEDEAVALALTLNPAIRAKRFGSTEARSHLVTAGLWPNPVFALAIQPGVAGAPGFTSAGAWLLEIVRVWERSTRIDAETATVAQTEAEIVAAEWALVAEVRSRRWAVLDGVQTVALLRQEAELRTRALEVIRKGRDLGETRELDLALAELGMAEVQRDLRRAETELETARRNLNQSMALPHELVVPLVEASKPVAIRVFEDLSDDELETRLLAGRFELRAKEFAYERAEHDYHLAIYRQYPPLGVGPSFQSQPDKSFYVGPTILLELPIFNQNQGEIAEGRAARDRVGIEYAALLHRLKAEAYEARGQLRRAKLEVEAQERDVLPVVERSQKLLEQALKLREIGTLGWITAQRRALLARREYVSSLLRYQNAVIRIEVSTGMPLTSAAR